MADISYVVYTVLLESVPSTAFALLFGLSLLRYSEQKHFHGSLLLEDWIHLLAVFQRWLLNISISVQSWLVTAELSNVSSPSADPIAMKAGFISNVPQSIFYWTSIYTAKACILVFYRRLFGVSRTFMRAWWGSAIFTIAAFAIGLTSVFLNCGYSISSFAPFSYADPACYFEANTLNESSQPRQVAMALSANISSDLLLLILPLPILLRIQAPWSRRLKFLVVASLVLITICMDFFTWLFQFNENLVNAGSVFLAVEPHITVIVATLPVLLFSSKKHQRKKRSQELSSSSNNSSPGQNTPPWRRGRTAREPDEMEITTSEFEEANTRQGSREDS